MQHVCLQKVLGLPSKDFSARALARFEVHGLVKTKQMGKAAMPGDSPETTPLMSYMSSHIVSHNQNQASTTPQTKSALELQDHVRNVTTTDLLGGPRLHLQCDSTLQHLPRPTKTTKSIKVWALRVRENQDSSPTKHKGPYEPAMALLRFISGGE
eukprot:3129362-Amphidinium_carterae.1